MVRNKMFDNIMKVIQNTHTAHASGDGTVSVEIDLELPRGYVAKVKKVIFEFIGSVAIISNVQSALVNDPDDATTITIPENTVDHDVIADHNYQSSGSATGYPPAIKMIEFGEDLDVICPRNIRHNSYNSGSGDTNDRVEVYYTLEPVSSELLVNLLDIL